MGSAWTLNGRRVDPKDVLALIDAGLVEVDLDAEGVTVEGITRGKSKGTTLRVTEKGLRYYEGLKRRG